MRKILSEGSGEKSFLLGNEAIARGFLEAGGTLATTYPGTPASEIGDTLHNIAKDAGIYFEYSTNEKVAMEVAGAGAMTGHRTMVSMKSVGLNVAAEPLVTLAYNGVEGGMLIVVADDPFCHSTQTEQDTRYYARLANLPILEPSSPDEAREMASEGIEISEELGIPIILRTTTRVSHVRGSVDLKQWDKRKFEKKRFEKNPEKFAMVPALQRKKHEVLTGEIFEKAKKISEKTKLNKIERVGEEDVLHAVTSGPPFNYLMDVMRDENVPGEVFKLGMSFPLPEDKLLDFLKSKSKVVVAEEVEPILEKEIREIANFYGLETEVLGKRQGVFPRTGEFDIDVTKEGLNKIFKDKIENKISAKVEADLPSRPPTLCPGCPHRAVFYVAKKIEGIYPNDIGCYTLGIQPPYNMADCILCMGSSIGTGSGFSIAAEQDVISFIGDSTFFHAGIPPLINAVHNQNDMTVVVLDNRTTAMTGFQPHPGTPEDGMGRKAPELSIEKIAESCGSGFVRTINPIEDLEKLEDTLKEAVNYDGVSVVVARAPCTLRSVRKRSKAGEEIRWYEVDQEECTQCRICIDQFACPAFYTDEGTVKIEPDLCNDCGVCVEVCPVNAVRRVNDEM